MSYIKNRVGVSGKIKDLLERRLKISQLLDPYSENVDMVECSFKGIKSIVYDMSLDTVILYYTDKTQGFNNIMIFCDLPTATDLDETLNLLKEYDYIDLDEYFSDKFNILWDYTCPNVYRLVNFNV